MCTGEGICEIATDNADNPYFGKCLESRHCSRYHCLMLVLFLLMIYFAVLFLGINIITIMFFSLQFVFYFAGSAVGFKLDSLLKLSDTRARNNKMTLMHYLCKV